MPESTADVDATRPRPESAVRKDRANSEPRADDTDREDTRDR